MSFFKKIRFFQILVKFSRMQNNCNDMITNEYWGTRSCIVECVYKHKIQGQIAIVSINLSATLLAQ
jgi:hypothetical protein